MKQHSFSSFAKPWVLILSAAALTLGAWANERQVDVWYDAAGNPRRVTVVGQDGRTTVVEIDMAKPETWRARLKGLGIEVSALGKETLPDTEQLGNTHQLMQYRGFDRNAIPEGTYFSRSWGYPYRYSYPVYCLPRGGGHYCRPHHARGGGLIFSF